MADYWMVRLGYGGDTAEEMIEAGYIGVDWDIDFDISPYLGNGPDDFRRTMKERWLERVPEGTKVAATRVMNLMWDACEGIRQGDIVVTRKADRYFASGTVVGGYEYFPGEPLPHRRRVEWHPETFTQDEMSPELARAIRNRVTVFPLSGYAAEVARLTGSAAAPAALVAASALAASQAEEVQHEVAFQLERQLEDFLVHNWRATPLGRDYDIFEQDGEVTGQQYRADGNTRMDILAVSKDRKRLLVVELKRGRVSDVVVGQIQRYMGFVKDELLEPGQSVEGVIIGREDDLSIQRALRVANNIRFMKYRVEFHLE